MLDKNYNCDISHYNDKGYFVGLDETNFYYYRKIQNMPSSFSTALNVPESAKKMVVTFTTEKENELKHFAIVSGLVLLGAIAVKMV